VGMAHLGRWNRGVEVGPAGSSYILDLYQRVSVDSRGSNRRNDAVIRVLMLAAMISIASPEVQAFLIGFSLYYWGMKTFYSPIVKEQ
jgi:hypothetical protein